MFSPCVRDDIADDLEVGRCDRLDGLLSDVAQAPDRGSVHDGRAITWACARECSGPLQPDDSIGLGPLSQDGLGLSCDHAFLVGR